MEEAEVPQLPLGLLELPEDLLLRIALQLKLGERLRLGEVCRKLRQLCAGPSELWRSVATTLRVQGGGDAAMQAFAAFRR